MSREYTVLVVATLVWGSVHPTVKFALSELTSVQLALLRPVCACAVLTCLVLATGRGQLLGRELRAAPGTLTALGVLGYAGSGSLAALALGLLPAGVTALISNSSPLMVVMAGLLVFHQRVGRPEIAGTLVGFGGVALLGAGDIQATGDLGSTLLGGGLALGSATCWAGYTAVARRLGGADQWHGRRGDRRGCAAHSGLEPTGSRLRAGHHFDRLGRRHRDRVYVRRLEFCPATPPGDRGVAVRLSDSGVGVVDFARLAGRAAHAADTGRRGARAAWRRPHPTPSVPPAPARRDAAGVARSRVLACQPTCR